MNHKQKGLIYSILFALFWAINIVLIKFVLRTGIHPILLIFFIFITAFTISAIYSIIFKRDEFKKINKKNIWKLLLIGLIGSGIANIFNYQGLDLSTSMNYGFVIKTGLVFTIFLSYVFLNEKLTKEKIILVIVLLIGVYLISTAGESYMPNLGDLLIVVGAFCYSVSTIIAKPLLKSVKPEIIVMFRTFSAALFMLLLLLFTHVNLFHSKISILFFLPGIITFFTLIFLNKTLEATTASYMSMMSMLTPVIVIILAFFILKETMNLYQVIGGLLIIGSGLLIQKTNIYLR